MICEKCNERLYVKEVRHNPDWGETYRQYVCKKCDNVIYTSEFEVEADDRFIEHWRKLNRDKARKKKLRGEKL